ncbi:phosphopantetheine-binding protein [Burkholderia contaminans]|uniref:phosphopantetheine-binding protein n=1 Tax=Burkholderia contaminans TaxID=488447 RepID=UPI001CEDE084|nr:phosphopantetheine-binding protein [Burkholderia contaminans]
MVPSAFVVVSAFEHLPNGKLDRARLPEPGDGLDHVAPVNALEAQLAAIWQEVLGQARISTTANFFELGGNSLLATKVVARIRRDLHAKLEIRSLFALPTISSLAKRIADTQPIDYAPVTPLPAQASYALSPAQTRLWVQDRLHAAQAEGPLPTSLLFEGVLDVDALVRAFRALSERHEILRTFRAGRQPAGPARAAARRSARSRSRSWICRMPRTAMPRRRRSRRANGSCRWISRPARCSASSC